MKRVLFLFAVLAAGCTVAATIPMGDTADSAQTSLEVVSPEPELVRMAYPAVEPPRPSEPLVALCEDTPSGLHWRAGEDGCLAVTSRPVVCPASAVRELDSRAGVVVCAD